MPRLVVSFYFPPPPPPSIPQLFSSPSCTAADALSSSRSAFTFPSHLPRMIALDGGCGQGRVVERSSPALLDLSLASAAADVRSPPGSALRARSIHVLARSSATHAFARCPHWPRLSASRSPHDASASNPSGSIEARVHLTLVRSTRESVRILPARARSFPPRLWRPCGCRPFFSLCLLRGRAAGRRDVLQGHCGRTAGAGKRRNARPRDGAGREAGRVARRGRAICTIRDERDRSVGIATGAGERGRRGDDVNNKEWLGRAHPRPSDDSSRSRGNARAGRRVKPRVHCSRSRAHPVAEARREVLRAQRAGCPRSPGQSSQENREAGRTP